MSDDLRREVQCYSPAFDLVRERTLFPGHYLNRRSRLVAAYSPALNL